ncbi:hypothetical protein [Roseovarius salinarum]|uniref:hypothetical protein n=1 Tax=Roseovarius salinarum TaxID=1981892 RepID=UPI000C34A54D|nr:hypothetical protein [Roseovarius salinarum]
MLIFVDANIVLFATPKTGSTAYHTALRPQADIAFVGRASLKHMPARKYHRHLAPYLREAHGLAPERVAVMRDPLDHARSWYRYRCRPAARDKAASAAGVGFSDFVEALIARDPPEFAKVGNQFNFLTDRDGNLLVDHLFAYERKGLFHDWLEARLDRRFTTKTKNASPPADTTLDPQVETRFRAARTREYALYDRLLAAGGHLETPVTA